MRLIRLARLIVSLLMVLVGLVGGGRSAAPSAPAYPTPPAAVPSSPAAPARVVPHGPTPHCTTSGGPRASDGANRWVGVCLVYGQSTPLPGDYATQREARATVFAFQQAWRDAVASGAPL